MHMVVIWGPGGSEQESVGEKRLRREEEARWSKNASAVRPLNRPAAFFSFLFFHWRRSSLLVLQCFSSLKKNLPSQ